MLEEKPQLGYKIIDMRGSAPVVHSSMDSALFEASKDTSHASKS